MSYLCAVLAALFAFTVLAHPTEVRLTPAPTVWSHR